MNPNSNLEARIGAIRKRILVAPVIDDCEFWQAAEAEADQILLDAQAANANRAANRAWFIKKICTIRLSFIRCFGLLKGKHYYKAWCDLEQIEIGLNSIVRNKFDDIIKFCIPEFVQAVANWQGLFPYRLFASPEFLHKEVRCSICDSIIMPLSMCTHKTGRVYCGRECYHVITKFDILGIAVVTEPVQKYSVLSTDVDGMDYSMVKFVVDRLHSPFDGWTSEWTEAYHPHELFYDRVPEDGCPCGSGRSYRQCCLSKPGVIRPHLEILFDRYPPDSMPNGQLVGYGPVSRSATLSSPSPFDRHLNRQRGE